MGPEEIDLKVKLREEYRKVGDYEMADWYRDRLRDCGVIVEDKKDGTSRWRYA